MATNLKQVKRGYANLKRSGTQMYYETMGSGDPTKQNKESFPSIPFPNPTFYTCCPYKKLPEAR